MVTDKRGKLLGFSSDPNKIKNISMQVITLLQDHKRGDIVIALACLWLGVCERFNVKEIETLSIANRMRYETFDEKHASQFRALKDYMENEL